MTARLCFLSHFVICLAIAAGAFFAYINGVPQLVYASDLSHMTSVIALIFVGSVIWIGRQAWQAGDPPARDAFGRFVSQSSGPSFGHTAKELALCAGLIGTGSGLALQGKALMVGAASFGALSTSLFTMICGVGAYGLVTILDHNLQAGRSRH